MKQDGKSGGDVMTVFFSIVIGVSAFNDIAVPMRASMEGRVAVAAIIERVTAVPEIEPKVPKGGHAKREPNPDWLVPMQKIEFKDVKFTYPSRPDVPILKGINLEIKAGQKVAFVGESGSGKSTAIQLLERFYDADEGEVLVNGHSLKESPVINWREQIGYVGQEPFVFNTTIQENIRQGAPGASDAEVMQAAEWSQLAEMLDKFPDGIHTQVGANGGALSGGQKQRVAIARALVKKPAILLLDEATSALDNNAEKEVQAVIDSLSNTTGQNMTTISIAHRLSTIKNSDVIFFLEDGRVVERGSHNELMALKGGYYNLVQTQAGAETAHDSHGRVAAAAAEPSAENTAENQEDDATRPLLPDTDGAGETGRSVSFADLENGKETSDSKLSRQRSSVANLRAKFMQEGRSFDEKEIELERKRLIVKEGQYKPPTSRIWNLTKDVNYLTILSMLSGLFAGAAMPVVGWQLVNALNDYMRVPQVGLVGDDGFACVCPDPPTQDCLDQNLQGGDFAGVFSKSDTDAGCNALFPGSLVATEALREISAERMVNKVGVISLSYVGLALGVWVFTLMMHGFLGIVNETLVIRIRLQAFKSMIRQEIAYHDSPDHAPGILSSFLSTSATCVGNLLGSAAAQLANAMCGMILGITLSIVGAWQVGLVLAATAPVVVAS